MASTYSPNLKIQLMTTGENETTWGAVTNVNLGTAIEEAIANSATVTFASNNVTLTLVNSNATQTARNMRLRLAGTTGGSTRTLTVPAVEKLYVVKNECADTVTVQNPTGSSVSVPAGKSMLLYSTGTGVGEVVTYSNGIAVNVLDVTTINGGTATFSGAISSVSPAFTGTPTVPTAVLGTNTTQVATTAFVQTALNDRIPGGVVTVNDVTDRVGINQTSPRVTLDVVGTDAVLVPTGTSGQRPVTPLVGMFRMNTTLNMPEWYDATNARWNLFSDLVNTYVIEYLIVGGGGGGGGSYYSGGGGGGGVTSGIFIVTEGTSYSVIIGGGGVGTNVANQMGINGNPSSFGSIIAPGGGGGGSYNDNRLGYGLDGGCGGGNSGYYPYSTGASNGYGKRGNGMMGYSGGWGAVYGGGGGGGAGAAGSNGGTVSGGSGGNGRQSAISGTSTYYGGGGGGGGYGATSPASGGLGGGGAGGYGTQNGVSGTANTGGGGGGVDGIATSGSGGSGIVIVRYFGGQRAGGGTATSITVSGAPYTVHTFTSNGTFTA